MSSAPDHIRARKAAAADLRAIGASLLHHRRLRRRVDTLSTPGTDGVVRNDAIVPPFAKAVEHILCLIGGDHELAALRRVDVRHAVVPWQRRVAPADRLVRRALRQPPDYSP